MKKIYPLNILAKIVSKQKAKGKKIALCHGVFDLLHVGHLKHFNSAKKFGDVLIVSVTHDKFVFKGFNRFCKVLKGFYMFFIVFICFYI